jgi:cytochrome c553
MKSIATLLIAATLAVPAFSTFAAGGSAAPAANAASAPAAGAAPATPADAAVATVAVAKPDLNAGSSKYAAVCAACHGADGNSGSPANPKLAQQLPAYMVKQLQDFKSGVRPSPIMKPIAAQLSEADMKNISFWASTQAAKPGFAKDKELVALGEKIYRGGILERQIAACAGCHLPNGAGIPAQYPRLSGQHADYTAAQLVNFRDGARKNSIQMNQIASRLNDREIRAVSDYIAGLR